MLADVHVVLVRPQKAGNLGAVARALKNFGLSRLTLVDSQVGSLVDAYQMAVHAHDVLDGAARADDLAAVIAEARWVVGTTNRPQPGMQVLTPREVAEAAGQRGPPTLLFGCELHGLTQAELLHCHAASTIPVAKAQSSLNLAQAVCVYAAELFARWGAAGPDALPRPAAAGADLRLLQELERLLTELLLTSAWRDASRKDNAIAELVQPLYRARLTEAEVRAWLVALGKAAQR
ncbi:MAG: RNA methyltransferase [Planctomycetota bacterium]